MKKQRLEELIKEISRIYFISLRSIYSQKLSSGEPDIYSPFYKYYMDVEDAFMKLDREKQTIITKEYFYDGYSGWWENTYKKAEFEKIRRIAVKEFVEAFYEIH